MEIRKSKPTDLDTIMEIYAYARKFMEEHGNPNQWGPTHWPPKSLIEKDIAQGKSYVCQHNGNIVGVFFFDAGQDIEATYRNIEGKWIGNDNYGVVHRIATNGIKKGVGSFCIDWAYQQCGHLRIDTHTDNVVMQNLLTKLDFKKCGIIYVAEDNYPRFAYEK